MGINGKVVECINRKTGQKFALKVRLFDVFLKFSRSSPCELPKLFSWLEFHLFHFVDSH